MDVDLHALELRHHDLRIHDAEQRRRLIGSVAEIGQQVPVVVIREGERLVLIDGYLRVEALRKLGRDTATATTWPVSEVDALLHRRHLCMSVPAIEDAWLLARLREHGLSLDDIARRLCRSKSWVSRRLALIEALTPAAQQRVRAGTVPPHAAMKYLVPLARANKRQCEQLIAGLGETRVSDRELAALYDAWRSADRTGRQRIVAEPLLVLRALAATATADVPDESAPLHKDLTMLAAIAWRASRRIRGGDRLTAELTHAWRAAKEAFASLGTTIEETHAGPDHPTSHPETP
ncbi:MAG: ParB N-terminal domain-containing protein [Acidobacteriota bacterium]